MDNPQLINTAGLKGTVFFYFDSYRRKEGGKVVDKHLLQSQERI